MSNNSNYSSEDISSAANAAMTMLDKINNERFKQLNQINNEFVLTTFYHVGGNLADSCKPDNRSDIKVVDPRYICVAKESDDDPKYRYFLNYVLHYKLWQRVPVYDSNAKDTLTGSACNFYPESFNSILSWLIASTDFSNLEIKFRASSHLTKWSNIMASLYYFDKLSSFKQYAQDVYDFSESKINALCALPHETSNLVIDRVVFDSATKKLTQLCGMSRTIAIKNHLGLYVTEASYCTSALKNQYLSIKAEYDKAVEDIKKILAGSPELTLCWNSANVEASAIGSMNATNGGTNIHTTNVEQVVNCAGEQLAKEISTMDDDQLLQFAKDNRDLINKSNLLIDVNKKLIEDVDNKLENTKKTLNIVTIVVVITCVLLFALFIKSFIDSRKIRNSVKAQPYIQNVSN